MTDVAEGRAVRLQRAVHHGAARAARACGSTCSTPLDVAGVARRPRAGRRSSTPAATSASRSGGSSPPRVIVIFLFGFGTYELVQPGGAGGGQGSNPIWTPTSKTVLPIQVIGQQWKFTYRYPTFGGFETNELVSPRRHDDPVQRHVARRDPQLLGLSAGREGRRQPRLQQRGLHHAPAAGNLHRALFGTVRDLARRHVQQRRGGHATAVRGLGQAHRDPDCARTPSCCRRTP